MKDCEVCTTLFSLLYVFVHVVFIGVHIYLWKYYTHTDVYRLVPVK